MGKAGPEEWKEILTEMGDLKPVPSVPCDVPSPGRCSRSEGAWEGESVSFWGCVLAGKGRGMED